MSKADNSPNLLNKLWCSLVQGVSRLTTYVSNSEQKGSVFTVVGRHLYREWQQSFPMNESKAVKQALSLTADEFDGYLLRKGESGGCKVTCWRFLNKGLHQNGLLFPESVLLGCQLAPNTLAEYNTPMGTLFVANKDGAIHSARKTSLMSDVKQFAVSVGLKYDSTGTTLEPDYAAGVISLLPQWARFSTKSDKQGWPLWRWALPVMSAVIVYLGVSSLYLNWSHNSLSEQYDQRSAELSEALDLQTRLSNQQQQLTTLATLREEATSSFPVWKLIVPLYQQPELQLRRITMTEDGFELFGQAPRATDILRQLTEMPGVNASFNRPVSSRRGQETFSIALTLNYDRFAQYQLPSQQEPGNDG